MKRHPASLLLWIVFAASVTLTIATLIAVQPGPAPVPAATGPQYPRVPGPIGAERPGELLRMMGIGSLTWHVSILSAPLFLLLARMLPLDRRRWPIALAVNAALVALLSAGTALVQHRLTYTGAPLRPELGDYLIVALLTGTLPFLTVAAVAHALEALSRARSRQIEAARIAEQLAEARLESLTAQLQPHFLFNTLQAISTLIRADPEAADRMLARLADLLRDVLRRGERREVPLAEELQVLEPYLDISRWRHGERLSVRITTDAEARAALVPFFLLQPLVENAFQHGVASRDGPATVEIEAERRGDRLRLVVRDDGPGARGDSRRGLGLATTRARLEQMFGSRHSLAVGPSDGRGFEVAIELPYRAAAVAESV